MFETSAIFSRKESEFEPESCIVEKVIRLSGAEYDSFVSDMLRDQDFIKDNVDLMRHDSEGKLHCLLVAGEGRRDGILVDSSGSDYARYSAFIPNVEGLLTVGQYPALAELNKTLTDIVDFIAEKTGQRYEFDLREFETTHGIDFTTNGVLRNTIMNMLYEKTEIKDWELNKNELIVYYNADSLEHTAEDFSDPSVTRLDMNVYGYDYDGMIPLGKERALELYDKGHEIYLLYEDDTEGCAENRKEIEDFDGLFGIEHHASDIREQSSPFEVLILNWEQYHKGKQAGEWLPLPADAETLRGLFERIGADGANGSYAVANVRMPMYDILRYHISKHDSLDELNMLASYMSGMEDYELDKLQAILTSGVTDIRGITDLINLLNEDNFSAVELIDAKNAYEFGRYYEDEKPDNVSFEEYGNKLAHEEKGVFTESGYLYNKYEQQPEYTGVVPDEYKIVEAALQVLRSKTLESNRSDEKLSVVDKIRASRQAQREPKSKNTQTHKKDKGGQEH